MRRLTGATSARLNLMIALVLASALAMEGRAEAALLGVVNAGFEDPVMGDNDPATGTNNLIPGWSGTNSLDFSYGVWNPPATHFPDEAPEGQNIGYLERGSLLQTLPDVLVRNMVYTLSVDVGRNAVTGPTFLLIELLAGDAVLASATVTDLTPGTFVTVSLSYKAGSHDPALGLPITIRFSTDDSPLDGTEISLDNVTLDARTGRGPRPPRTCD